MCCCIFWGLGFSFPPTLTYEVFVCSMSHMREKNITTMVRGGCGAPKLWSRSMILGLLFALTPLFCRGIATQSVSTHRTVTPQQHSAQEEEEDWWQVRRLMERSRRKQVGSSHDLRLWRRLSVFSVNVIKQELAKRLPHPVDSDKTNELEFQLGIATKTFLYPCRLQIRLLS